MNRARPAAPSFLQGGGEMGRQMRSHDWSATALGPAEGWPGPLATAVSLLLRARQPMFIGWGPELVSIYNDGYIPICGAKHPHALGRPMSEVWADVWDQLVPMNAAVFAGESLWHENKAFNLSGRDDDEPSYFSFSYTPLLDVDGSVGGIFCSAIETTANIRLAHQREAELRRQRRLFQQAPGFIAIMSGAGHVVDFVNDAHMRLFHSEDWPGQPLRVAFPDLEGQGFLELLDEVYASGERVVIHEAPVRYRTPPADEEVLRYLDFIYAPIVDDAGVVTGIFCEGYDVTEAVEAREVQRSQQRELEQLAASLADANRRQSEFLATLAHELRNPLAPIRNSLAVMRLCDDDRDVVARTRPVVERQVGVLVRLIDDLLDIARISGGKLDLRREDADVRDIVAQALETSMPVVERGGHVLELDLPNEALPVHADPVRVSQVVSNLLHNAAKYTPPGGVIRLSARRDHETVVVDVADTGVGIPAADLPNVFDMFSQVGNALPDARGGLGIGLALVKRLVELHGGSVDAHSEGPGRGSRFRVRVPYGNADADAGAGAMARVDPGAEAAMQPLQPLQAIPRAVPRMGPLRVAVVDDNHDAADTLATLLRVLGHQACVAYDGHAGLDLVRGRSPDVAFIDIGLPDFDGYAIARALVADPVACHAVLVALTGWGTAQDRARAREAGFHFHLTKPAAPSAVEAILASVQEADPGGDSMHAAPPPGP